MNPEVCIFASVTVVCLTILSARLLRTVVQQQGEQLAKLAGDREGDRYLRGNS